MITHHQAPQAQNNNKPHKTKQTNCTQQMLQYVFRQSRYQYERLFKLQTLCAITMQQAPSTAHCTGGTIVKRGVASGSSWMRVLQEEPTHAAPSARPISTGWSAASVCVCVCVCVCVFEKQKTTLRTSCVSAWSNPRRWHMEPHFITDRLEGVGSPWKTRSHASRWFRAVAAVPKQLA